MLGAEWTRHYVLCVPHGQIANKKEGLSVLPKQEGVIVDISDVAITGK